MSSSSAEVLVIGGGVAGSATALVLAHAGCRVTLLEREFVAKNKVCGEFLSGEALQLLHRLGVHTSLDDAPAVQTVRLASAHRAYEAKLPFPARSLSRRAMDAALLEAAADAGVEVVRGQPVERLSRQNKHWRAELAGGRVVTAPQAVLATGKHDLRGFPRPQGTQNGLLAVKMYFRLQGQQTAALQGAVELLLHPHGYTGLQLVEDGSANLTAVVERGHFSRVGGWQGLLDELRNGNRHAAQRLEGAEPLLCPPAGKPLALGSIPYGFVRQHALAPTLYAVGDQAAVIPSFTGDGMAIALYTGIQTARAILAGEPATGLQLRLYRELRGQVARATMLSRVMVQPALQPVAVRAVGWWPGALRLAASLTRLPRSGVLSCLASQPPAATRINQARWVDTP